MIFKDCYWGSLTLIPVAHYMPWNKNNIVNLRCKGINTFFNQNLHQCFRFINFCIKATWYNLQHYHLEVQANTPKNGTKKDAIFSIYEETGLSHDISFNFSLGLLEWWSLLNLETATSKFCKCSWKIGSSPQKGKVNLCLTSGSKVLIYLTLLYVFPFALLTRVQ